MKKAKNQNGGNYFAGLSYNRQNNMSSEQSGNTRGKSDHRIKDNSAGDRREDKNELMDNFARKAGEGRIAHT